MTEVFRQHIVNGAVEAANRHLEAGTRRIHVDGGAASGRSSVCRALSPGGVLDVLGPGHPDMVGDALLQVMALTRGTQQPTGRLGERLSWMQQQLSDLGQNVVVRLHASWGDAPLDADPNGFHRHAARWLSALLGPETRVPVVLVGSLGMPMSGARVVLEPPWVDWSDFEDHVRWRDDNYRAAAFSVRKRCQSYQRVSPIVARLVIGRFALGDDIDRIEHDVSRVGLRPRPHVEALVSLASNHREGEVLLSALQRVSRLRRPLPCSAAARAAGLDENHPHIDLINACVGYEQSDRSVRWSEPVATALRASLGLCNAPEPQVQEGHYALAEACETVDGVDRPEDTEGLAHLRHWAEKVHHLARSGDLGAEAWARQDIRQVEQLWERARALSLEKRYVEAVELYRRCVDSDPADAYAWHYIGFNLDQVGKDRGATETALRRAVKLETENPWWNSRLVTWLIGQVRYRDAEQAWELALGHIDPSGTREDVWLAHHLYRHVVGAWLDAGEIGRARTVFEVIPERLRQDPSLRELEARLVDYEEAYELQGSVRPYGLLGEARWQPRALPEASEEGQPLRRWYGGRVVGVGDDGVQIRAASSSPGQRRVMAYTATWDEWRQWGGIPHRSELQDRFVELGEYGNQDDEEELLVRLLDRASRPDTQAPGRSWVDSWRHP